MAGNLSLMNAVPPVALETRRFDSTVGRRSVIENVTAKIGDWLAGGTKGTASVITVGDVNLVVVLTGVKAGRNQGAEPLRLTPVNERQFLVEIIDPDAALDEPSNSVMLSQLFNRLLSADKAAFASDADSRATIKNIKRSLSQRSRHVYQF